MDTRRLEIRRWLNQLPAIYFTSLLSDYFTEVHKELSGNSRTQIVNAIFDIYSLDVIIESLNLYFKNSEQSNLLNELPDCCRLNALKHTHLRELNINFILKLFRLICISFIEFRKIVTLCVLILILCIYSLTGSPVRLASWQAEICQNTCGKNYCKWISNWVYQCLSNAKESGLENYKNCVYSLRKVSDSSVSSEDLRVACQDGDWRSCILLGWRYEKEKKYVEMCSFYTSACARAKIEHNRESYLDGCIPFHFKREERKCMEKNYDELFQPEFVSVQCYKKASPAACEYLAKRYDYKKINQNSEKDIRCAFRLHKCACLLDIDQSRETPCPLPVTDYNQSRDELIKGCHHQRNIACRNVFSYYSMAKSLFNDNKMRSLLVDFEWIEDGRSDEVNLDNLINRYKGYSNLELPLPVDASSKIFCSVLEQNCQ